MRCAQILLNLNIKSSMVFVVSCVVIFYFTASVLIAEVFSYEPIINRTAEVFGPTGGCSRCFRLPGDLEPIVYDLKLTLNSESEDVLGQVLIEMQCHSSTSVIQLHMDSMFVSVQHAILENKLANETIDLNTPNMDWDNETVEFVLVEPLKKAFVYYLSIWFTAKYSEDGHGLTRNFDLEHGTWLNTLLEPVYARRVFPCFDEPKFRAVFKLELWLQGGFAQKGFIALSNTPGQMMEWNENLTIYEFEPTPPLPSYLFAFSVGQFRSHCNTSTMLGKEICVWRFAHVEDWESMAENVIHAMEVYQMIETPRELSNFNLFSLKEWLSENNSQCLFVTPI